MATVGSVILTVVDVGQGQCTFVEIYDDTTPKAKLIHTLLFDCGSGKKSTATAVNIKYISERIKAMDTPTLDCIFFSHSDVDHINLTKDLLDECKKLKDPLPVKEVWYGGARQKYTKGKNRFNILNYLETNNHCATDEIAGIKSNYSQYEDKSGRYDRYLWSSTDNSVKVYLIVGGVMSDDPNWNDQTISLPLKQAEVLNRISLICGLYYAGVSFVICGDATNTTMAAVNKKFKTAQVFNKNKMTTLPHHGSRTTGFAVKGGKEANENFKKTVKTFSTLLKSENLTVSAYQHHRHPSLELMNTFIPAETKSIISDFRLKQKNAHRLTAYYDVNLILKSDKVPIKLTAYSFDTGSNTFSTRYSGADAPYFYGLGGGDLEISEGVKKNSTGINYIIDPFACWQYKVSSGGSVELDGYAKLKLPLNPFTKPAVISVIQILNDQTGNSELKDISDVPKVFSRKKDRAFVRQPAQRTTLISSKLKHFH